MTGRAVGARLQACWRRWPAGLAREARRYCAAHRGLSSTSTRRSARLDPYWLRLPAWLLAAWRPRPRPAERSFLADVQWGQFALFLFVRIHDDLFDGQAESPPLVYVADQFLLESERTFARHLNGRFWSVFRDCLSETLRGIADADALQRQRHPPPGELLQTYARVSSIFKVGAAAVCARCGRLRLFPRVSAFADELAIAGQILDDLSDVEEDLARGRRNVVAASLLGRDSRRRRGPRDPLARLAARIVLDAGLAPVLDQVDRRLEAARAAIAPLRLRPADRYLTEIQRNMRRLRDQAHRVRVEAFLGGVA